MEIVLEVGKTKLEMEMATTSQVTINGVSHVSPLKLASA